MKPIVIDKEGEMIIPTDWASKSAKLIEELGNSIFAEMTKADSYDYKVDKFGNEIKIKKRVKKGDIMPDISPSQVSTKLNRLLRIYRPMSIVEAKALDDTDYLEAYGYFLDVVSYINEYCVFLADKQTFSSFCNITTDVYNELLGDPNYTQVFKGFEDDFVHSNFAVAQSGLVDTKTTITKLTTKEAGHSLLKTAESVVYNISNNVDKQQVLLALDKFDSMTKKLPNSKN